MHMSYDDFCRMTIAEFAAVYNAYIFQRDFAYKDAWERTRMVITTVMQTCSGEKLYPYEVMPFAWDEDYKKKGSLTPEARQKRTEELMEKIRKYEQQHN